MDNHNHGDDKMFSRIMGLMVFCCLLPLAAVFFGGGALLGGGFRWWTGVPMLIFIGWHFWMMRRGRCRPPAEKAGPEAARATEEDNGRRP